jgi:hypothetical protein
MVWSNSKSGQCFRMEMKTTSTVATFRRNVAYLMISNSQGSQGFAVNIGGHLCAIADGESASFP